MTSTSSATLAVLAVDDELPALDELAWLLRRQPEVGTVATASEASDALRQLRHHRFDAVFLDVRMPGFDGLELAGILAHFAEPPAVVFVTAFDEHAVEAFEVRATDYLLKPVREERLGEALRRITRPSGEPAASAEPIGDQDTIPVESGGRIRLLRRDEVTCVEASGDYVRLHTATASYLIRTPISALEASWAKAGFMRVHRSYLVPLRHISEFRPDPHGGYLVRIGDREVPVSRRHARDLKDRLIGVRPRGPRA
jgi:two-component system, LytTR family, response regulator LytT